MDKRALELLHEGLAALDIEDEKGLIHTLLVRYIRELEIFNTACNLIKVANTAELVIKHILDSLAPWKFFAQWITTHPRTAHDTIADVGSGSGMPGIPLACLFLHKYPHLTFTLIERMHKRCAILENIKAMLNLTNTLVLETDAEKAPADYFDIAVFRAFRPLDSTILTTLHGRIRSGGILAGYKGKRTAIEKEMNALGTYKPPYRIEPLYVPFYDAERNLVIMNKPVR